MQILHRSTFPPTKEKKKTLFANKKKINAGYVYPLTTGVVADRILIIFKSHDRCSLSFEEI